MGDQWNFGKASDRTLDAAIAREMGFGISVHGSNLEPPMSALGQKQTYRIVRSMSALRPKADIRHRRLLSRAIARYLRSPAAGQWA